MDNLSRGTCISVSCAQHAIHTVCTYDQDQCLVQRRRVAKLAPVQQRGASHTRGSGTLWLSWAPFRPTDGLWDVLIAIRNH